MIKQLYQKILIIFFLIVAVATLATLLFLYNKNKKIENELPFPIPSQKELNYQEELEEPTPPTLPGFKTYRVIEWGFEFQYPENLIRKENFFGVDDSKFTTELYPELKSNPVFTLNIVLPEFAEKNFKELREIISEVTIDRISGTKYQYKFNNRQKITIIIPLGEKYRLILDGYKEHEDIFNQIIASFKFLPPIPTSGPFKIYRNKEWGFEFQYPKYLILKENAFVSYYSKFNLEIFTKIGESFDSSFLVNIVLPEFAERSFRGLEKTTSKITVAGVEGIKYEYNYEGFPHTNVILPIGELRMILATGEGSRQYLDEFNQILSTFKFLK